MLQQLLNRLAPYTQPLLILAVMWYTATQYILSLARRRTRSLLREEVNRREAAEAANKAKAFFLTNLSHEIRTPLNAIVGFTDLALRSSLNPELREYLGTVRTSADWLTHVVGEVLDFSRMEAGIVQLSSEPFSLRETLRSAMNIANPQAAHRKLVMRLHLDAALPNLVLGDSTRLLQIVFNLLENATRFTTSGSILVTALVTSADDESVTVRISVADTGIGIDPERLESLFQPLAVPAAALDRRTKSCGFGLPICQRLVALMGGRIEVKSRAGVGSTFSFSLTFEVVREAQLSAALLAKQLSVLVADPDAAGRRLAVEQLQRAGHRISEASNGVDCLRLFAAGKFDLVIVALELPELNGIDVTKAIRATEPHGKRTPIWGLASCVSPGDEPRCLQAGMSGLVHQPRHIETIPELSGIRSTKSAYEFLAPAPPAMTEL